MEQVDLLRRTVELLEGLAIPYMIVGSFASSVHGEPRLTQDIDIVIDPTACPERTYVERWVDQLGVRAPSGRRLSDG